MLDLRHGGGAREAELKETPVQVVAEPRGAQALLLVLCWARAWQGKGLLFRSRSRQGLLETRRACVILDSRFIISPSEVHGNRRGLSPPSAPAPMENSPPLIGTPPVFGVTNPKRHETKHGRKPKRRASL